MRRRIYDAWNVLKAASIIVEYDDKHFRYNPAVLKEFEIQAGQSEEEIIQERLQLTAGKGPHNMSINSSGSQTFN